MAGSALLLIRLVLTAVVVAAAWRFGLRGVFAALLVVAVLIVLLKARKTRRNLQDWR
jgi:hypothetical protein